MPTLSVVLITKNQAWNIARLIESVLQETAELPSTEIVLVDSASTDDTVEVARHYPINILRLHPTAQLTPAAGRYIGYKHSTNDLVLFLDGDMQLYQGWLTQAIELLNNRPDIAVVTGQVIDLPKLSNSPNRPVNTHTGSTGVVEVPHCGGAGMYRRAVLERVGTFNPYLRSDEEPELCIRIRHANYHVVCIDYPIAYHYSDPSEALSTLVARWKRNLYLGAGQNIRYHLGQELLWPYLKERGYGCVPGLGVVAACVSLLWSIRTVNWVWFRSFTLLLFIALVGDAYRKGSVNRTMYSLLQRMLILDGTVRGFFMKPLPPREYPDRLDVIQWIR
jgi:glycosyltransferase involved in cell wall biosynthesis